MLAHYAMRFSRESACASSNQPMLLAIEPFTPPTPGSGEALISSTRSENA